MRRLPYALLVGAVGAGLIHAVIAALLPTAATEETWARVKSAVPADRLVTADLPFFLPDRLFRVAACRFNLATHAMRLRADGPVAAWFLSIYGPDGKALASLSDERTPNGLLDLVVLTPAQRALGAGIAVPMEVDAGEVLAVLEIFVPDASWSAATASFLRSAACKPLQ